jgi:hypothetical protein
MRRPSWNEPKRNSLLDTGAASTVDGAAVMIRYPLMVRLPAASHRRRAQHSHRCEDAARGVEAQSTKRPEGVAIPTV